MTNESTIKEIFRIVKKGSVSTGVAIITLMLTALGTYVSYLQFREIHSNREIDISTRLEKITESLSQDADELRNIEIELENRIVYVQELKTEAELAESILDVSEAQLNAIHSMISEELEANNKKNLGPTMLNNLFFCILGMITPPLIKWIIKKIKNKQIAKQKPPRVPTV